MNKKNIGRVLKVAGLAIGVITAITLINTAPIQLTILGVSAVAYFIGVYLKKQEK